jgi:hypothetical protein
MWAPIRLAFFYARPVVLLAVLDGFLVPFQGTPFRFLCAPPQAVQQAANMIAVVFDRELAADQFGDTRGSP